MREYQFYINVSHENKISDNVCSKESSYFFFKTYTAWNATWHNANNGLYTRNRTHKRTHKRLYIYITFILRKLVHNDQVYVRAVIVIVVTFKAVAWILCGSFARVLTRPCVLTKCAARTSQQSRWSTTEPGTGTHTLVMFNFGLEFLFTIIQLL